MHRLRNWVKARSGSDFDHTGPAQTGRIARDLGLSSSELVRLVRGPDVAALLRWRLSALQLDARDLRHTELGVLRHMQRVCAMCASKGRCAYDLEHKPANSAWREYCQNAGTLDALELHNRAYLENLPVQDAKDPF